MSGTDTGGEDGGVLEQEFHLDAPPAKVWRAISIAELREVWLPGNALADPEPCSQTPGREVSYRMRGDEAPFLESVVTFRINPDEAGGTRLRILHRVTDEKARPVPANANGSVMRAA